MALIDVLTDRIQKSGWLSIANIYFDNSHTMNVIISRGYVAYSPSSNCFFQIGHLDSLDSQAIETKYICMESGFVGQQCTIIVLGDEHMQHFDISQFTHDRHYIDIQTEMPYPKVPTEAELNALVKDDKTGLYNGTDTITYPSAEKKSVISLIDSKFFEDPKNYYTAAVIDQWKRFYHNHNKFKVMLKEAYGISDCI